MYMNNPINYCLQRIKNEIPKEILNIAVVEDNSIFNNNITIDEKIITKAIKQYMLLDLSIISTFSKKIDISKCIITPYTNPNNQYEYIVEIPDALIDGMEVVSASYIIYNMLLPQMGMMTGNAMDSAMGSLLQAHSSMNMMTTNRLDVIGRNMILVNTGNINWSFMNSSMEVNIAPNPNMSHVKGDAIIKLGDIAVEAAKCWIHNTLSIQVDQGYIRGGHSIDTVKSKIDGYESAFESYREKREGWGKIGFMLDTRQYQKFIEMQLG